MNNEIGRKLTSLTLMTIMLAAGFTAFAPSAMPQAAAANANLFVSAENSQFQNAFAGPMVIEVVVIDSDIKDTDKGKGEPDVTVNGKDLRMVQATDGNWYGYFADVNQARLADQVVISAGIFGEGLDFGEFCSKDSTFAIASALKATFTETVGIAVNGEAGAAAVNGNVDPLAACNLNVNATAQGFMNVVREEKAVNTAAPNGNIGQIGIDQQMWPFVQLYIFNPTGNVVVQYNKGGGVQATTLKFDTVDQYAKLDLDRAVYPQRAQVQATITDIQLNIDPTDEDSWTFATNAGAPQTIYQLFDENGQQDADAFVGGAVNLIPTLPGFMFEDNGILLLNPDTQGFDTGNTGVKIVTIQDNGDSELASDPSQRIVDASTQQLAIGSQPVTFTEIGPNTGIFGSYDESDKSAIAITTGAARGKSATIDYNDTPKSIVVGFGFASIDFKSLAGEWNSGEVGPVTLKDSDANKNSRGDEDLDLNNPEITLIPSMTIGAPITLEKANIAVNGFFGEEDTGDDVDKFSQIMRVTTDGRTVTAASDLVIDTGLTGAQFASFIVTDTEDGAAGPASRVATILNYDLRSLNSGLDEGAITSIDIAVNGIPMATNVPLQGHIALTSANENTLNALAAGNVVLTIGLNAVTNTDGPDADAVVSTTYAAGTVLPIAVDILNFGIISDGALASERINNAIYRYELEETGDNTSEFIGSTEYIMLNQLNVLDAATYDAVTPISDEVVIIVHEDLTDESSPRINYNDLAQDGSNTPIGAQQAAPTHSGVVSFDKTTYKKGDTVTITLEDQDLNTDVDLIDIYSTVVPAGGESASDTIGKANLGNYANGDSFGRLLDITFDDIRWLKSDNNLNNAGVCAIPVAAGISDGLTASGLTLIETKADSGMFTGDFLLPNEYCDRVTDTAISVTGTDIEVNYVDFRDASGQTVEFGDGAGVRAHTGSVSLDRTVYPVPFGALANDDFTNPSSTTPSDRAGDRSIFPLHLAAITIDNTAIDDDEVLASGDLSVHIRVNDPDFDESFAGEDKIAGQANVSIDDDIGNDLVDEAKSNGPVKVTVSRGASSVVIATAGGSAATAGEIATVGAAEVNLETVPELGPINEVSPASGIFEADLVVRYSDGPSSATCPDSANLDARFQDNLETHCILQGDIITVEYNDPTDASGDANTVTDSATFDLRNGALQSDKSVYIIGSDMILTLIEPDFDLDNDEAETYDLDLIEWDSDADTITMGDASGQAGSFDPEPSDLRETGDSTGIFQIIIEIPNELGGDRLERGEEIVLEYSDWGPAGADFVGQEDEDVNLTLFTSNFGATVELDSKVYSWTDKVYITVVAPDHNFDSNLVDEIGDSGTDPLKVSTRGHKLDQYKLTETGTDTGIFTGEVILTGFAPHDADGDGDGNDAPNNTAGQGPTNGFLQADDDDGLTVSYEFSEDETIVGSALIRWNIGEVSWLESSYPAVGTGVVQVIDPDMNLNPEAVDNFATDVWSDSDSGGIDLTVTETNEATGIFEGVVSFTTTDDSSGHRLRVAEGDTVTAEYHDQTLPDPYTRADELDITAAAFIGTVVPPLERAPASNARVVDAFGSTLDEVTVDQQVQITADLTNGQDREQPFAYLVQIQDEDGVTVSLAWITGSLSAGQSFSPALSWIPTSAGTYTATVFVWESVDNPTALSEPVSVDITVS